MIARPSIVALLSLFALAACFDEDSETGLTSNTWAFGYTWNLTNIEWHSFQGQWELRAVIGEREYDQRSARTLPDSNRELLLGVCNALLDKRPHAPEPNLGRSDIFRVSLNVRRPEDDENAGELVFSPAASFSVNDIRCAASSDDYVLPLSYGQALEGVRFSGFMATLPPEVASLNLQAAALFEITAGEGAFELGDLPLLCEAARYESHLWRVAGPLADGDRIAIAVQSEPERINFFPAVLSGDECLWRSK